MSPHSPSSTILFFVFLKSKTFWKSCFCLLSLLSHLFPSCIIIIVIIVIIVVTKLVLLFWSHGCKELSYSYCSTCEYHLQCGQGPFVLYFVLYPSLLISTLLSLSTTYTHKFALLEYLNLHYFLRQFYCTVLKTSTVSFSLRDHKHADENVVLESHLCHLLTRWLYANYVTLSFCIPCV